MEAFPLQPSQKERGVKNFDEHWYKHFISLGAFQDVELLVGEKGFREEQKELFLKGEVDNPALDYPELKEFDFKGREMGLLDLKRNILAEEENEVVKQAYRWKINEKIAELRMLRETLLGNDKKVARYSNYLYGKPDLEIYQHTLSKVKNLVDKKLYDSNPHFRGSAEILNRLLFDAFMNNYDELDLSTLNVPAKKEVVGEELNTEAIKEAFEDALQNEYALEGWQVVIDEDIPNLISLRSHF